MTTKQVQILACIDGSALTNAVCDYAAWISKQTETPLKLLHSINHHQETSVVADFSGKIGLGSKEHLLEEFTDLEQQRSKLKMREGKKILEAAAEHIEQQGMSSTSIQRHGDLIEAVTDMEESISVLVLGLRGQVHDKQKNKIGAKLESVIRALHHPILIVNDNFKSPEHIMIAYDGSEAAEKAVAMVASSPLYKGLVCHLVCVNDNRNTASKLLNQASTKLQKTEGIEIIAATLKGKVYQELCAYQQRHDIDLTVMGAFSHSRAHDVLLGSFTHKMLVNTKKPLLLLR